MQTVRTIEQCSQDENEFPLRLLDTDKHCTNCGSVVCTQRATMLLCNTGGIEKRFSFDILCPIHCYASYTHATRQRDYHERARYVTDEHTIIDPLEEWTITHFLRYQFHDLETQVREIHVNEVFPLSQHEHIPGYEMMPLDPNIPREHQIDIEDRAWRCSVDGQLVYVVWAFEDWQSNNHSFFTAYTYEQGRMSNG